MAAGPLLPKPAQGGDRVFCHSTHTRPSQRGEKSLFRGEKKTTRPRRPQQKTNGAREPKRNRKAPGWVSAGKTPNKKQEQRGSQVSGLRRQQPQTAQNDLDLVDERGREGKEAEEEQAIPNRANRKYKR